MPFIIIAVGILFIILSIHGTYKAFFSLIVGDFTGSGNFIYWVISILIIGAIGYIPRLKVFSDSFLFLVLLVLFIANKGVFSQFNAAIKSATNASGINATPLTPVAGIGASIGYNTGVQSGSLTALGDALNGVN